MHVASKLTAERPLTIYIQDIMDADAFWKKDLLRADEDMLFSCFIDSPKGTPALGTFVRGIRTGASSPPPLFPHIL